MKRCETNTQVKDSINKWQKFDGRSKTSYLDWYFCDRNSNDFAVRDVSIQEKLEPHYEDYTFNVCRSCNQPLLKAALSRKEKYIFFFTKYTGVLKEYKGEYFITGYYKISAVTTISYEKRKFRQAVKANESKFVKISDAFNLRQIVGTRIYNSRRVLKRLDEDKTNLILRYFKDKKNRIDDYIRETKLLTEKRNDRFNNSNNLIQLN